MTSFSYKIKGNFIAMLLLAVLVFFSSCSSFVEITHTNFSPKSQQAHTWCWAAITQAIQQTNNINSEQYILVQNRLRRTDCGTSENNDCYANSPCATNASASLNTVFTENSISFSTSGIALSASNILSQIQTNKPIAFIKKQPGVNNIFHVVLIVGITNNTNETDKDKIILKVFDPGPVCKGKYENWTLTQYENLQAGTYYNFKPTPSN